MGIYILARPHPHPQRVLGCTGILVRFVRIGSVLAPSRPLVFPSDKTPMGIYAAEYAKSPRIRRICHNRFAYCAFVSDAGFFLFRSSEQMTL